MCGWHSSFIATGIDGNGHRLPSFICQGVELRPEYKTGVVLNGVNVLLLVNFVLGFFPLSDATLFSGMFHTTRLIVLEKNMLNLATLIISLQAYDWLKDHRHVPEFYMLLLATLTGFFFMISAGNLLMFYLGLELSTIPLAALSSFDLEKRYSLRRRP